MGTDTVGYTVTDEKPVFEILATIEEALAALRVERLDIKVNPLSQYAVIDFKYATENRSMFVFFRCDSDYEPAGQPKVIFSLGLWGRSIEIIRAVAQAMTKHGKTVFCEADTEQDWQEVYSPAPAGKDGE